MKQQSRNVTDSAASAQVCEPTPRVLDATRKSPVMPSDAEDQDWVDTEDHIPLFRYAQTTQSQKHHMHQNNRERKSKPNRPLLHQSRKTMRQKRTRARHSRTLFGKSTHRHIRGLICLQSPLRYPLMSQWFPIYPAFRTKSNRNTYPHRAHHFSQVRCQYEPRVVSLVGPHRHATSSRHDSTTSDILSCPKCASVGQIVLDGHAGGRRIGRCNAYRHKTTGKKLDDLVASARLSNSLSEIRRPCKRRRCGDGDPHIQLSKNVRDDSEPNVQHTIENRTTGPTIGTDNS